ncbi:hypothetical protein KL942_003399 [Ogataea angusta]|uniref:Transcription activator GCR1-like domain-containing protein n=1 Tax=Pichia angusta TaxID=870730 RepID=A0ABQ7RWF4_PICAN|nr:hypothetical protein KL942_003399 [Ogataea angusta]KAG7849421.1 hypothetical protein KL940_003103 [Ogataea angusta]
MDDRLEGLQKLFAGLQQSVESEELWKGVEDAIDSAMAQYKAQLLARLRKELQQYVGHCKMRLEAIRLRQSATKNMLALAQADVDSRDTVESKTRELRKLKERLATLRRQYRARVKPGIASASSPRGKKEIPESVRRYRLPRGPRQNKSLSLRELYEAWFVGNERTPDGMPIARVLQEYPNWSSTETTYFNRLKRVAQLLQKVGEGDVASAVDKVEAYMQEYKVPGVNALSDQCSKQKDAPGMEEVVRRVQECVVRRDLK